MAHRIAEILTPPFQLDDENLSETTRLTHRVLDLRRPTMQKNMMLRHRVTMEVRRFLDAHPIARDAPGALPQALDAIAGPEGSERPLITLDGRHYIAGLFGEDGLALLAYLAQEFEQVPVIIMTAHSDLDAAVSLCRACPGLVLWRGGARVALYLQQAAILQCLLVAAAFRAMDEWPSSRRSLHGRTSFPS